MTYCFFPFEVDLVAYLLAALVVVSLRSAVGAKFVATRLALDRQVTTSVPGLGIVRKTCCSITIGLRAETSQRLFCNFALLIIQQILLPTPRGGQVLEQALLHRDFALVRGAAQRPSPRVTLANGNAYIVGSAALTQNPWPQSRMIMPPSALLGA